MSVVGTAKLMPVERTGGDEAKNGIKRFMRRYRVDVNSNTDDQLTVLAASGLPRLGDGFIGTGGSVPEAKVSRRNAVPTASWYLWYVDIEYSTENDTDPNNPTNEPADLRVTWEPFKEPLPGTARQGDVSPGGSYINPKWEKGITNAAGEPFDPPYEKDSVRPIVIYARNEPLAYVTMERLVKFMNSVNKTAWSGLSPRQAFCRGIEPVYVERQRSDNGPPWKYFRTTYTFAIKKETWDLQLLNQGTFYLDSNLQKKTERDADGNLKKVLLNRYGNKYTEGTDPVEDLFLRWPRAALPASGNYPAQPALGGVNYEADFNELGISLNLWLGNPKAPQPPPT